MILASGSPRRQQLLNDLGLQFEVVLRPVSEDIPAKMQAFEVAEHLAWHKSQAYLDLIKTNIVITSDTIVSLGGQLLEKPIDRNDAERMLNKLSGNTNEVISGVCIRHRETCLKFHASTKVHFRNLEKWEIDYYIDQFQPFDKAGAYGIQEWIGMVGIDSIEGDYYNVVGLPVGMVWEKMKSRGLLAI